ncbi:MAG: OmpH family outer membrane protein [Bacteroidota bacterium]
MKQFFLILSLVVLTGLSAHAQRFAFVDVDRILNTDPEYATAQAQLDQLAAKWKQEISAEYTKIDDMYRKYQAEQVLLSETVRQQREDEIVNKEKEVRELQKKRFGPEGDLFKQRQELVQPIQERVYNAIQGYAEDRGFDFIFNRGSGAELLYANPEMDRTDDILKRLGLN